jgi:hypothetical protein
MNVIFRYAIVTDEFVINTERAFVSPSLEASSFNRLPKSSWIIAWFGKVPEKCCQRFAARAYVQTSFQRAAASHDEIACSAQVPTMKSLATTLKSMRVGKQKIVIAIPG